MGTFNWPVWISSMDGQQFRDVTAEVDTGSSYTTLPGSMLRESGIVPIGRRTLMLANNQRVNLEYGHAGATIDGESVTTLVVFGDDQSPALLGAYTLEGLALAVDPVAQRLVPTAMIMY